jgi:hypothetical protein
MNINYSFKITNIYCYTSYESLENLVFTVLWDYTGSSEIYNSNILGSTNIPYDASAEYKPYEQLTEAEVISWIEQYTDPTTLSEARALIEQRIIDASNPPVVINPKLPWDLS